MILLSVNMAYQQLNMNVDFKNYNMLILPNSVLILIIITKI